jgi:hypothetical protein
MRIHGINYDTGVLPGGRSSRLAFDPEVVRREMEIIAGDLRCGAVRITGGDPERLTIAGERAADAGLEVWFSPFPFDLTIEEMRPLLADCADRAASLRRRGAEVVLVTGCELTTSAAGLLPGATGEDRLASLVSGDPALAASYGELTARLNDFLAEAAADARGRARFDGRVTYASGAWEPVDWRPFDVVSIDAYRDAGNAATFEADLRGLLAHGRPVVATEFGCCTYRSAGDRGAMGWMIVDQRSAPPRLNGEYVRDEGEQVAYLRDLLRIFETAGLDGAFWFTFAHYEKPHRADPARDLDMASYGVVRVLEEGTGRAHPGLRWEPKAAFGALAEAYSAARPRRDAP